MLDSNILEKILSFKILPPEFDSKHTPITATFKCHKTKFPDAKLLNPPKAYKWNSQGETLFKSLINGPDFKANLDSLNADLKNNNNVENLKKATKSFTNLITEYAESLKVKKRCIKNKSPNKPWYNQSCTVLKTQLTRLAKLIQKNPKDTLIRSQYHKAKKQYKNSIKHSRKSG